MPENITQKARSIMQPQADPFIVPPCLDTIKVLYRDSYILVIRKPTGLLTLSGKHPLNKDSVHFRLVKEFPTATVVHRLDFGTSGVLVVALNKEMNAHLTKQFQARSIIKKYTAILHGNLSQNTGTIDFPITKDIDNFPLQKICNKTGKQAVSHFEVIERCNNKNTSRVVFTPQSGRTHQLRIHSREIGHPILGCDLYATDEAFFMAKRLMLHANSITFTHPETDINMTIKSACPF